MPRARARYSALTTHQQPPTQSSIDLARLLQRRQMPAILDDRKPRVGHELGHLQRHRQRCDGVLPPAQDQRWTTETAQIFARVRARHDRLLLANIALYSG